MSPTVDANEGCRSAIRGRRGTTAESNAIPCRAQVRPAHRWIPRWPRRHARSLNDAARDANRKGRARASAACLRADHGAPFGKRSTTCRVRWKASRDRLLVRIARLCRHPAPTLRAASESIIDRRAASARLGRWVDREPFLWGVLDCRSTSCPSRRAAGARSAKPVAANAGRQSPCRWMWRRVTPSVTKIQSVGQSLGMRPGGRCR